MNTLTANKERFISICREKIKIPGINDLLAYLETTDFYTAPASTRFHGSYEGGLLQHSLNVYDTLCHLAKTLGYNLGGADESALAIVALFHDLCKADFYKKSTRNIKSEDGRWIEKAVYEINEKYPLGEHADKSIIILQQYIALTEEEIMAIRAHMGGWDISVKGGSQMIGKIFEKSPLALFLHISDMLATYIQEDRG